MIQVPGILFAAAFTFCTCLLLGKSLFKLVNAELHRSEEVFLGFVTGAACLSTIVLFLGALHLAYTWVFFILGCAICALAYARDAIRFAPERLPSLPRPWALLFWIPYSVYAFLYFMNALAPESSSDGAMFHVALPALYLREHHIPAITTNFLATFPEGAEMLFLFAFAFGKHSAAAMVQLLFLLLLPLGILSYARRIGSPGAGVMASLLFMLSPAAAQNGTTAMVDVVLAAVVFAVFYLVQIWREKLDNAYLVPLGLVAGFAYSIKYTAFLAVPYALSIIVMRSWRSGKAMWRPCATASFCALAVMSPWMIKNMIVVGNPVSPFANRVFRNPYLYVSTEDTYKHNMGALQDTSWRRMPYEVTVRGGQTQGLVGPLFLLTPLALAALAAPAGRQLLFAAAVFLAPFYSYPVARILLPALPFVSLALGLVFSRWNQAAFAVIVVQAIAAWPPVISTYANRYALRPEFPDWRAALRLMPEAAYLEKHLAYYDLETLLETKVPPHDRILAFQGIARSYDSRDVVVEWQSAFGVRLGESLLTAVETWRQPTTQIDFHFETRTVRSVRLLRTTSINEFHVLRSGLELPRRPEWRLRAFPNPWDVQFAFDNSPLTRWASREPAGPETFIEVDFGQAVTIDQVRVECTAEQAERGMLLEGIQAKVDISRVVMPERLRRAAIEELKRNGIRWLVVSDRDPAARDLRLRSVQWGVTPGGEAGRDRLYRLD